MGFRAILRKITYLVVMFGLLILSLFCMNAAQYKGETRLSLARDHHYYSVTV